MVIPPTKGIHYYNLLKTERGDKITKADFARLQREGLESYFIELIRAVVSNFRFLFAFHLA
jgi:phospholipase D1/2